MAKGGWVCQFCSCSFDDMPKNGICEICGGYLLYEGGEQMDDCVWCLVDVCNCDSCHCEHCISGNTKEGGEILNKWSDAVKVEMDKIKYKFAVENGFRKRSGE